MPVRPEETMATVTSTSCPAGARDVRPDPGCCGDVGTSRKGAFDRRQLSDDSSIKVAYRDTRRRHWPN
jgi:hypothetical protein